jgi:hypothetical protein
METAPGPPRIRLYAAVVSLGPVFWALGMLFTTLALLKSPTTV